MSVSDFDWWDDDSVVVREHPALAIYANDHGDVVIRRKADCPDEAEDSFFTIDPARAVDVAQAVLNAAGVCASVTVWSRDRADEQRDPPAPTKDRTAAERQRRRRARLREECRDSVTETVTERDSVTPPLLIAAE